LEDKKHASQGAMRPTQAKKQRSKNCAPHKEQNFIEKTKKARVEPPSLICLLLELAGEFGKGAAQHEVPRVQRKNNDVRGNVGRKGSTIGL